MQQVEDSPAFLRQTVIMEETLNRNFTGLMILTFAAVATLFFLLASLKLAGVIGISWAWETSPVWLLWSMEVVWMTISEFMIRLASSSRNPCAIN